MTITTTIPSALRQRAQWVLWRAERKPGDDKPSKIPYSVAGGRASSTNAATWATFDEAWQAYERKPGWYTGLGYVFSGDDGLVGIDLDDCRDPTTGEIEPWARAILDDLRTYCEVSPSGTGVKAWAVGGVLKSVKTAQVEVYNRGRYFAFTGNALPGYPTEPQPAQDAIERIVEAHTPKPTRPAAMTTQPVSGDTREAAYAMAALKRECEDVANAPSGMRNNRLNQAAFSLGQLVASGLLDEDVVIDHLSTAAQRAGLSHAEIYRTINSGLRAGLREPRQLPPSRPFPAGRSVNGARPAHEENAPSNDGDTPIQPTMSEVIVETLRSLGYSFRLNLCNDVVEVNGEPITDVIAAQIRTRARDAGLKGMGALEDVYLSEAFKHAYHPVKDYLNALTWDGDDHIGALANCLISSDEPIVYEDGRRAALHAVYLRRWLIGAVAKVLHGQQNMMLVLAGPQGVGKSTFAHWLCSGLPDYFIEGPINPNDKDADVRLMSRWIWEVGELDATTRKQDISALKAFITKQTVTVRKAYGRHDTVKGAIASMIGTVNEGAGFLADETGSRRFWITRVDLINQAYQRMSVDQVWAQAVALYQQGDAWTLQGVERQRQEDENAQYDVESVLEGWIEEYFEITGDVEDRLTAANIVDHLASVGVRMHGSERAQAMEISRVLQRHKTVAKHRTASWRGYTGIRTRAPVEE